MLVSRHLFVFPFILSVFTSVLNLREALNRGVGNSSRVDLLLNANFSHNSRHCSVGNRTSAPLPLVARPGEWLSLSGEHSSNGLALAGQPPFACGCTMGGVWQFLGEGYVLRDYPYATACTVHDVAALNTSALSPSALSYVR